MTPGREDEDETVDAVVATGDEKYAAKASAILAAVGGKDNVKVVDYCTTRLRFEVADDSKVDEAGCKAAGARGVVRPGANAVQVIVGTDVQFVCDELQKLV